MFSSYYIFYYRIIIVSVIIFILISFVNFLIYFLTTKKPFSRFKYYQDRIIKRVFSIAANILLLDSTSCLALSIGIMAGQSRVSVIAAVITSIMTLVLGLIIYVIKQGSNKGKFLISFVVILFSFFLIVGANAGTYIRTS